MVVSYKIADSLVCHCYGVTESEIRETIETVAAQTVEEVVVCTRAGGGCTACHCRIRRMIAGLPPTNRAARLASYCEPTPSALVAVS